MIILNMLRGLSCISHFTFVTMVPLKVLLMVMVVGRPTFAADHIVGDNNGWNPHTDYTVWANGRDFHVGDSITFMYTPEEHDVIRVNASEFEDCSYSNATDKIWSSGFDVLALASPGKHWYISGMNQDCSQGMKLVVNVSEEEGPAPAPMPGSLAPPPTTSAADQISPINSYLWLLPVMAAYRMIFA